MSTELCISLAQLVTNISLINIGQIINFRSNEASSVEGQMSQLYKHRSSNSGSKPNTNISTDKSPVTKSSPSDSVVRAGQESILNRTGWKEGVLLNIQVLYPNNKKFKVQYLNDLTKEANLLFLALTKTHLNSNILDAEIQLPNYNIFRQDRKESHTEV